MGNQADDRHPRRYFNAAKGYQIAADRLLLTIEAEPGTMVQSPTYFLYAHAVELALKACLLSHNFKPPRGGKDAHDIIKLFGKCLVENLISLTDQTDKMLINALGSANECHEYRYPDEPKGARHAMPDLKWTREFVGQLIAGVEPHIAAWTEAHPEKALKPSRSIGIGKPSFSPNPSPPTRPGP